AIEIINDLEDRGLIMQIDESCRGRRATYKVFPAPGDEIHSASHKKGKPCPGADKFGPVPSIPTADEVSAWCTQNDQARKSQRGRPRKIGSEKSNPSPSSGEGSKSRTQSPNGSDPADEMGPIQPENGFETSDPFSPRFLSSTSSPLPAVGGLQDRKEP